VLYNKKQIYTWNIWSSSLAILIASPFSNSLLDNYYIILTYYILDDKSKLVIIQIIKLIIRAR